MAIDSLPGNQFWGRLLLLFNTPAGVTMTWFPTARILFLMPFFLLISIRQYILPKLFPPECLRELDAAEYKEIVGKPWKSIDKVVFRPERESTSEETKDSICDAEILDEMTTYRGELMFRKKERLHKVYIYVIYLNLHFAIWYSITRLYSLLSPCLNMGIRVRPWEQY